MRVRYWLHILFGGCKQNHPNLWCNGCFYRAWNKLHPDLARTNYGDPAFRPAALRIDGSEAPDDLTLAEADDPVALAEVPIVDGLPLAVGQVGVALGEEVVEPSEEASHPAIMPTADPDRIDGGDGDG